MELLEGHSLTQELHETGVLSIERCAKILLPVCDVLSQVHAAGIVHRDIKPDNIFLHQSLQGETIKVVDFGIAKLMNKTMGQDIKDLTATGGFIGTATYMSPERFESKSYDGRADVYSLGVMLFQMLCGKVPFQAGEAGQVGVLMQHLLQPPPPPRTLNPNIPTKIETVMLRALEKDPEKRPTAKQLAEEFAAALSDLTVIM
jgi:serine/threonine protein kinase